MNQIIETMTWFRILCSILSRLEDKKIYIYISLMLSILSSFHDLEGHCDHFNVFVVIRGLRLSCNTVFFTWPSWKKVIFLSLSSSRCSPWLSAFFTQKFFSRCITCFFWFHCTIVVVAFSYLYLLFLLLTLSLSPFLSPSGPALKRN